MFLASAYKGGWRALSLVSKTINEVNNDLGKYLSMFALTKMNLLALAVTVPL